MATHDLTQNAVTISGNHSFLAYSLNKAREDHEALYEEINKFDVTIAPYCERLTGDERSGVGTGSKIYHYFAMGKPVVISYMAGLSTVNLPEGFLYMARSDEEYPALVNRAWKENSRELIRKRMEFARANTWGKRMEDFIALVRRFE